MLLTINQRYYEYFFGIITNKQARMMDVLDVSLRRKSIEEMQCGNFEWYMTNVAPTHIVPYKDIISHGEV